MLKTLGCASMALRTADATAAGVSGLGVTSVSVITTPVMGNGVGVVLAGLEPATSGLIRSALCQLSYSTSVFGYRGPRASVWSGGARPCSGGRAGGAVSAAWSVGGVPAEAGREPVG